MPHSQQSPTIRDIAAHLGLSHNTVARALRNAPRVSQQTRERVLLAAQEMGYRPNPLITALMTDLRQRRGKRSGDVLSWLTVNSDEHSWKKVPSLVSQYEGARARGAELGFDLQHMWLGPKGSHARRISQIMKARSIRGALLAPTPWGDETTLDMDWRHFSCIMIGNNEQPIGLSRTVHNSVHIISRCYKQLHLAGCRSIGLALPPMRKLRQDLMVSGFLGQQWDYRDSTRQIEPLIFADNEQPRFLNWVERNRPDAVIGIWPDLPLQWLREHGVKVPEDICYATLDLADSNQDIAGIMQDNETVGRTAINLLVSQLFSNEIGPPASPITTMVKGKWRDGSTVRLRTLCK